MLFSLPVPVPPRHVTHSDSVTVRRIRADPFRNGHGVNKTRRYLCEALSFQYCHIPIGLLERLPARTNERAPVFQGRDELGVSLQGNVRGSD